MFHCFFKLKVVSHSLHKLFFLKRIMICILSEMNIHVKTLFYTLLLNDKLSFYLSRQVYLSKCILSHHLIIISFSSQHYKAFWVATHSSSHIKHLKTYCLFDIVSSCLFTICMTVVLFYVVSKDKRFIYYFLSLICLPLYNLTYFVCCFI